MQFFFSLRLISQANYFEHWLNAALILLLNAADVEHNSDINVPFCDSIIIVV